MSDSGIPMVPDDRNDGDSRQGELSPLNQVVELERERIESYNRRTDLGFKAIEAESAADKQFYDYNVMALEAREARSRRGHSLVKQVVYVVFVIVIFTLGMLFFGEPHQVSIARDILAGGMQSLGGGAVLYLLYQAGRWLLRQ